MKEILSEEQLCTYMYAIVLLLLNVYHSLIMQVNIEYVPILLGGLFKNIGTPLVCL